jgi:hypothetical protein
VLDVPPPDAVLVLHAWNWTLSSARRQSIERWVESGGRLVVDDSLAGAPDEFERWSGVVREYREMEDDERDEFFEALDADGPCREFDVEQGGQRLESVKRRVCDVFGLSFLRHSAPAEWALRDRSGLQAVRVKVGRGSVAVINASPFRERELFEGDHGWLFVAATGMRRGDRIVFLSERDHPSLLALTWQHGAPVVVLALALIALALWRGGVRFGPLAAPPESARRSLAEQIRGTGQFVLRHGSGEALLAAATRALNEAAQRHIPHYSHLSPDERIAALAKLTGFDRQTIAAAVHQTGVRRSHNLRASIALVESVRRQLIIDKHGT